MHEKFVAKKIHSDKTYELDQKAKLPLELGHTAVAGPMPTPSIKGHRYAQSFTDYSGTMIVYFLESKTETVQVTERFLVDVALCDEVRCIPLSYRTEFMS